MIDVSNQPKDSCYLCKKHFLGPDGDFVYEVVLHMKHENSMRKRSVSFPEIVKTNQHVMFCADCWEDMAGNEFKFNYKNADIHETLAQRILRTQATPYGPAPYPSSYQQTPIKPWRKEVGPYTEWEEKHAPAEITTDELKEALKKELVLSKEELRAQREFAKKIMLK